MAVIGNKHEHVSLTSDVKYVFPVISSRVGEHTEPLFAVFEDLLRHI